MAKPLSNDTPLKPNQKKFIKHKIATGNSAKAATLAGFGDPGYGSYLMKQPKIQNALQQALDKAGITDELIAKKIKQQLEAYHVKKDGGKKYPDYHARDKGIDKVIKIKGGYAPEKHEIRQEKLVLIITPETIKGLKDAKAITEADVEVIEAEALKEEEDAEIRD